MHRVILGATFKLENANPSPSPTIVGIGIIKASVHEESICFSTSDARNKKQWLNKTHPKQVPLKDVMNEFFQNEEESHMILDISFISTFPLQVFMAKNSFFLHSFCGKGLKVQHSPLWGVPKSHIGNHLWLGYRRDEAWRDFIPKTVDFSTTACGDVVTNTDHGATCKVLREFPRYRHARRNKATHLSFPEPSKGFHTILINLSQPSKPSQPFR